MLKLCYPLLAFLAVVALAQNPPPQTSAARILARTKVLASDEFEGRAPGSAGEEKTVSYIVNQFMEIGLEPGNPDGTFLQKVPLVGIESHPKLSFHVGGKEVPFEPVNDFLGITTRIEGNAHETISVPSSDVIFVGYGVVAPEFNWDDYKGVNVQGKTLLMLINDPPVVDPKDPTKLDPKVFGGNAMTYYGRWTYKYEIAAKKGAAACIIIHETVPAAYPFAVLVGSLTRENFEIGYPNGNPGHQAMEAWMNIEATRKLFTAAGQDFSALKKLAATRDFHPVALGATASFSVDASLRHVDSKNVIAKLTGSDPKLRDEYVIYSAHWDHLGRDPKLKGDQIFNGAADNAAGVAMLLELANAYQALPPEQRPKRSILFLSITAEEKGLLGSRYYAENPLYPLNKTLANINMDGANQFGPTSDMMTVGYGASTLDDVGREVAKGQERTMFPESHPERGSYYRSDHFEFAKVGVPSYYAKSGVNFIGKPAGYGEKVIAEYIANDYHKVSDEVKPDWTFTGAAQDAEFLLGVGLRVANGNTWPQWREGNEFKARRDEMMQNKP